MLLAVVASFAFLASTCIILDIASFSFCVVALSNSLLASLMILSANIFDAFCSLLAAAIGAIIFLPKILIHF